MSYATSDSNTAELIGLASGCVLEYVRTVMVSKVNGLPSCLPVPIDHGVGVMQGVPPENPTRF